MFALIDNGSIAQLVETVPAAPDPLPDGYVAPDYRPVVDGTKPAKTSTFSAVIPIALDRWTIEPAQVVRGFEEVFPPLPEIKRRKAAMLEATHTATTAPGITVTQAPYGALTFAADAALDLIVCSTLCDYMIRQNVANAEDDAQLALANGSIATVKCKHTGPIVRQFLMQHRAAHLTHAAKLLAAKNATTIADLNAI